MKKSELEIADAEMRRVVVWKACCYTATCGFSGAWLCLGLAGVAWLLGLWMPLVGGPVFAILLGILIGNLFTIPGITRPGIAFCSKRVLQYSIILLGGGMSLVEVYQVGSRSLAVMLATLFVALTISYLIGRALKVDSKLTSLVGVGTGICGGSAIAAIAPIIEADDDEIAFSISTVFLFNIVAVIVFPLLGHLMHLSQDGFGIWAGTAINDTSSVVAAAFSYGQNAGQVATITKLARTTMIIPIALAFAFAVGRRRDRSNYDIRHVIPWFVFGFLAMAILNSAGLLGPWAPVFSNLGKFLIAVALAGVGLGANLRKLVKTGPRPILLGLLVWIGVAGASLMVQTLAKQL